MSEDIEFVEFKKFNEKTLVSINVVLEEEDALKFMDVWFSKVSSCQAPLIEILKNGLNVHIPWIMKEK